MMCSAGDPMDTVNINFENKTYRVPTGVSLLDSLQNAGAKIPASCRSGVCQSCLMQSDEFAPPERSQKELSEEKRRQGFFLACQCLPTQPMTIRLADEAIPKFEARVVEIRDLSPDIKLVRFERPQSFQFHAGQYVNLHASSGVIRSYSVASLPSDEAHLDIHVRRIPGGTMTEWLFTQCAPGDSLRMTSAKGDCCYFEGTEDVPFLLVGIGTGVAPLQAIARQALLTGKKSPLFFYQGALSPERLYFRKELRDLEQVAPQFSYREVVLKGDANECRVGDITDVLMQDFDQLKNCKAYLCGDANLVSAIRKKLFIAGIPMRQIQADAFVTAKPLPKGSSHELRS